MCRDYRGRELEPGIAAAIVEQDKADIEASSALLVYFDRPSVGTAMEIFYAHSLGLPVFVANLSGARPSPWLIYHSRCISHDFESALRVVHDHHKRAGL